MKISELVWLGAPQTPLNLIEPGSGAEPQRKRLASHLSLLAGIRSVTTSPNDEIEESFSMWLAEGFSRTPQPELNSALNRMLEALEQGDVPGMLEPLMIFFAQVPNTIAIEQEKYYQTIFYFDFKLNGTADEALAQIRQKRYFEPHLDEGRPVTLVGVEFSRTARNIGEHRIEPLDAAAPAADRVHEPPADFAGGVPAAPRDARDIARRMRDKGVDPAIIADVTGCGSAGVNENGDESG